MASTEYRQLLDQCIHCGLCLPACPTYQVLGTEMDSPRGRIVLMKAAATGRVGLEGAFAEHIDLCLGCRACETACPSGVRYGALLEVARSEMERTQDHSRLTALARRASFRGLLAKRGRLRLLARALRFYQRSGLSGVVRRSRLLPEQVRSLEALLPVIETQPLDLSRPAPAIGERRGCVALLLGCVQDAFFGQVNRATVRVLQRNGFEVHFPQAQSCCGAAPLHSGEEEIARELMRRNIDAFDDPRFDLILNNAGGCGSTLKEAGHLLADDPAYADRAQAFAAKVRDISEFLAENLHVMPTETIHARVVYADSCHLRHAQKVVNPPRDLLRQIPGITLVELQSPGMCCGSAGIYNILQPQTADLVLAEKMDDVKTSAPDILVTTNPGCQMQYLQGVRQAGLTLEVLHLIELLDRAYGHR